VSGGPIGLKIENGLQTALRFERAAAATDQAIKALVTHYGQLLNTKIKAKASGRPGPNAPTGDYRRSWGSPVVKETTPGTFEAVNGTNKPQGRRLEFGFTGTDSLDRQYHQPPYPHVAPAVDEVRPDFFKAGDALVKGLLK
jgi:hypothetical protein